MADVHHTLNSDQLRRGMETLPQELYDQIYDDVFTAPPGARFIVDPRLSKHNHGYLRYIKGLDARKSVHLLHVSVASRAYYATTFYGPDTVFTVHARKLGANVIVRYWLKSLSKDHREKLRQIVLDITSSLAGDGQSGVLRHASHFLTSLRAYISGQVGSRVAMKVVLQRGDTVLGDTDFF